MVIARAGTACTRLTLAGRSHVRRGTRGSRSAVSGHGENLPLGLLLAAEGAPGRWSAAAPRAVWLPGTLKERVAPRTPSRSTRAAREEHGAAVDSAVFPDKRSAPVCRTPNSMPGSRAVRTAGAGRPVPVRRPAERRELLWWWWLASLWHSLGARKLGGAGVKLRGASSGAVGLGTAPVRRQGGVA